MSSIQLIIGPKAEEQIKLISQWLGANISAQAKLKFLADLADKVQLINEMPLLCRTSALGEGLRQCPVGKHYMLYYRYQREVVEVVSVLDTRRDPGSVRL